MIPMSQPTPRFRNSWPLRFGLGILLLVFATWSGLYVAAAMKGFNPEIGPAGLWSLFWIIFGFALIFIGLGQTIVRRKKARQDP